MPQPHAEQQDVPVCALQVYAESSHQPPPLYALCRRWVQNDVELEAEWPPKQVSAGCGQQSDVSFHTSAVTARRRMCAPEPRLTVLPPCGCICLQENQVPLPPPLPNTLPEFQPPRYQEDSETYDSEVGAAVVVGRLGGS